MGAKTGARLDERWRDILAVHACCPVVALSAIAASRTDMHHGNVVVGWSRDRSARHALDVAADEARKTTAQTARTAQR